MPLPTLQTYPGIETPRPADAMMKAQTMKNEMARTGIAQQNADTAQKYLGLAGQKFGLEKETHEANKNSKKLNDLIRFMPTLKREEWKQFKDHIKDIDPDLADVLPDDVSAMTDEEWNDTVGKITYGAKNFADMKQDEYDKVMDQIKEQKKQEATAIEKQKDRDAAMARAKLTSSKETNKEKTPLAIRKELARMEKMKLQITKTGGMNELIFSMIAQSNPEMADKIAQNPQNATAEIDAYMDSLRAELPKDPNAATKRLIFQDGKFIEK